MGSARDICPSRSFEWMIVDYAVRSYAVTFVSKLKHSYPYIIRYLVSIDDI